MFPEIDVSSRGPHTTEFYEDEYLSRLNHLSSTVDIRPGWDHSDIITKYAVEATTFIV